MTVASPWRVGLTGGIASGKSTVAAMFAALGVPTIDLDHVAREVVAPGSALLTRVLDRFGPGVRTAKGGLNRRALRELVFADATARRDLEALLHPAIRERAAQHSAAAGGPYQVIVDPLIAESGSAGHYDRVLLVDCDEALQRQRLAQRDGATSAQAAAALAIQASRTARRAVAADVLENGGEPSALQPQVRALHERYLALAAAAAAAARR
jgi:dephospho-CoA kinase